MHSWGNGIPTESADGKRQNGVYYTAQNPFRLAPFRRWAKTAELPSREILEPFAGNNNLIRMLGEIGLCRRFSSFDLHPADAEVSRRDTLRDFPKGFDAVVTNPPWLARNSATRRGLAFPQTNYDDLYKHCLSLCLANAKFVAAIIPASFLTAGLFRARLNAVILSRRNLFNDTENPVCIALFSPAAKRTKIYLENEIIGDLQTLENHLPNPQTNRRVVFNDPSGNLGLIAIDNTRTASIRFCKGRELAGYKIGPTSRSITRIRANVGDVTSAVAALNESLNQFRKKTRDVFLTPFKGLRKDGIFRRRLDYGIARNLINSIWQEEKTQPARRELIPTPTVSN